MLSSFEYIEIASVLKFKSSQIHQVFHFLKKFLLFITIKTSKKKFEIRKIIILELNQN